MQDNRNGNKWLRRLLPLVVLALGVGGMILLVKTRTPPKRKAQVDKGLLVGTVPVTVGPRTVKVVSHGEVTARREVSVVPQVSGKVTWVNPSFVAGGTLRQGEVLLKVEQADYRLALERARASVARAEQTLAMERSNARVARQEWERLGKRVGSGEPSPLVLRQPQLKAAEAALASARADIKLAQLNLSRTVIRAPFNCRVRRESVEVGQYVTPGREVGQLFGTDTAEVVVPLPVSELRWLKLPRAGAAAGAAPTVAASVALNTGEAVHRWQGELVRTLGEIGQSGRMSRVVVQVDDPYGLGPDAEPTRPELQMGSFVEVTISGRTLPRVAAVPSEALRLGEVVWLAAEDDTLEIREVKVAKLTTSQALINGGLKGGERLIVTPISGAVEGMKLRVRAEGEQPELLQAEKPKNGKAPEKAVR